MYGHVGGILKVSRGAKAQNPLEGMRKTVSAGNRSEALART